MSRRAISKTRPTEPAVLTARRSKEPAGVALNIKPFEEILERAGKSAGSLVSVIAVLAFLTTAGLLLLGAYLKSVGSSFPIMDGPMPSMLITVTVISFSALSLLSVIGLSPFAMKHFNGIFKEALPGLFASDLTKPRRAYWKRTWSSSFLSRSLDCSVPLSLLKPRNTSVDIGLPIVVTLLVLI
jgi:hypothetical protein